MNCIICGLLLQTERGRFVSVCVCLCLSVGHVREPSKTWLNRSRCRLGGLNRVDPNKHALNGVPYPQGRVLGLSAPMKSNFGVLVAVDTKRLNLSRCRSGS